MRKFPCVFMRGGTSKGCMFLESDLPARDQWDDIFVQAMGSPDPKQIDGMGGCVSSNNKIVVVRKSDRPGIDVDYIVGQSIVGQSKIDYKSNCGNMTAATAPYAVEMGLVEDLTEPTTVVHMFNLNTNKTIDVEVPIKDGQFNNEGTCSIAGVDGTAGELKVNFLDPAGAKTGKLFPTGNAGKRWIWASLAPSRPPFWTSPTPWSWSALPTSASPAPSCPPRWTRQGSGCKAGGHPRRCLRQDGLRQRPCRRHR